jgi:hypothetical protein
MDMLDGLFSGSGCCGQRTCHVTHAASCGNCNGGCSVAVAGGCSTCGGGEVITGGATYSGSVAPSVPTPAMPSPLSHPVPPNPPKAAPLPKAPPMPPAPRGDPSAFLSPSTTIYSSERGIVRE